MTIKKRISYIFKVTYSLLTSQYALMLEYRAEIALWAISGLLPLIMLSLWLEVEPDKSQLLENTNLYRYFISAFLVRQFTAVWVMVSFEQDHIEGKLSTLLLQPITPFWRYISSHMAEQISRLPFVFVILSIIFIFVPNSLWWPGYQDLLLGFIAIFFAFLVRFLLHWICAMLCFWNERASSIERLLLIPYLFLSGLVAPLDKYPDLVKDIALATPFPYILSFPSMILSRSEVDILNGFLFQLGWIVVLSLLSLFAWKMGVRKYSAMGA